MPAELRQVLALAHGRYVQSQGDADLARREVKALMLKARDGGATNQEIGDVLGVSRQRVSQLLRKEER